MLYVAAVLAVLASQTEGTLAVDGGLSARYQHVFDRNAIADSLVVGDVLVALTPGGLLMKLSLPGVELDDVAYPEAPIISLGTDADGGLLAGDVDGGVHRIDVSTMTLTRVASVSGRVVAVGAYRASPGAAQSVVAVTFDKIHDLGNGSTWDLDYLSNGLRVHIDRNPRLWLGTDNGEWGGFVARVDLLPGKLKVYPDCLVESAAGSRDYDGGQFRCDGVHGFTELPGGVMLAHGGMTHLGRSTAWVARLDDAVLVDVFENEHIARAEIRRSEKPRDPITHVLEPPGTDELYVVAGGEVFRADRKLSRFRLAYKLHLTASLGHYPPVVSAEWRDDELFVSTAADGVLRLKAGQQFEHVFAGDIGAASIERIEASNDGILFYDYKSVWQQSAGDWLVKDLVPRSGPQFDVQALSAYASWQLEIAFVDAGGDIVSVSETNLSPGPRATIRWRRGAPTLLSMEAEPEGYLERGFATPDGELWATSRRGLYRWTDTGWSHAAAIEMDDDAGTAELESLGTSGPPWLLLERASGALFQLRYEGSRTRLRPVSDEGSELHDAVQWNGSWLFATSSGLRRYEPTSSRWASANISRAGARVLARDGGGRLWLAGDGLAVVSRGRIIDLSRLPPLAGVDVIAMIADPHRRDGVIVSLGERGLLYVGTD